MQGPPQNFLARKTVLSEPAPSKCTWTCHKKFLCEFQGKMSRPRTATTVLHKPVQSICRLARTCQNYARILKEKMPHICTCHKAILRNKYTEKSAPQHHDNRFVRNRNAYGHVAKAIACKNSHGKCRAPRASKTRTADFVPAWVIERHMEKVRSAILCVSLKLREKYENLPANR